MSKEKENKVTPTLEEYIAELIEAKKLLALNKSLLRKMPKVPKGIKRGERWNPITKKVEDIYETGNSCAYTFADNYGLDFTSSEDFRQNHKKYGFKQTNWENRKAGDGVLVIGDDNIAKHTMMYDSDNAEGLPLYNHSNGGSDEYAIRKKAKYPVPLNNKLIYTYVGTPADSTLWINEYKQIYGFGKGGLIGISYLKKGSGIHIKKKNRGKFTEYCGGEVTDECILKAKKSKNPKLRKRATFALNARAWKHEHGGILKCLEGTTEDGLLPRYYIGGTTEEARKKYFNYDKKLSQIISNLAASYNIPPGLVFDRLAHEGLIDRAIIDNNNVVLGLYNENLIAHSAVDEKWYNDPYGLLGLDNIFDTYTKGITKTKRPINFKKFNTVNESGESVNSGRTNSVYDALELFVAELASRRNQVKQQYPNLTDEELDSATAARYNATNKYFKLLMNSENYKTKYPINIHGINIPIPTKTDSKYIQDQNVNIDLDEAFLSMPYSSYVYDNKTWNPYLFLEKDNTVTNPNNKIVKSFLEKYTNNNFSEPTKVNLVYKKGGGIKLIPKKQNAGKLDIKGLMNDPEFKKNHNLYINPKNIAIANDSLIGRKANNAQIGAVLTQIISESGGETKPHGNGAVGLIGWRGERAKGLPTTLSGQLHHLMKGLFESHKDWSDGGPGMNIGTGKEMHEFFKSGAYNNYRKATNAVMNGYVRPPEDLKAKRHALVQIVKRHIK